MACLPVTSLLIQFWKGSATIITDCLASFTIGALDTHRALGSHWAGNQCTMSTPTPSRADSFHTPNTAKRMIDIWLFWMNLAGCSTSTDIFISSCCILYRWPSPPTPVLIQPASVSGTPNHQVCKTACWGKPESYHLHFWEATFLSKRGWPLLKAGKVYVERVTPVKDFYPGTVIIEAVLNDNKYVVALDPPTWSPLSPVAKMFECGHVHVILSYSM